MNTSNPYPRTIDDFVKKILDKSPVEPKDKRERQIDARITFDSKAEAIKVDETLSDEQKLYRLRKLINQTSGSRKGRYYSQAVRVIHPDNYRNKPHKLGSRRDLIRAGIMNKQGERTDDDGRGRTMTGVDGR